MHLGKLPLVSAPLRVLHAHALTYTSSSVTASSASRALLTPTATRPPWLPCLSTCAVDFFILQRGDRGFAGLVDGLFPYERNSAKDILYLGPGQEMWVIARFGPHRGKAVSVVLRLPVGSNCHSVRRCSCAGYQHASLRAERVSKRFLFCPCPSCLTPAGNYMFHCHNLVHEDVSRQ
jgi:hypothetical protein